MNEKNKRKEEILKKFEEEVKELEHELEVTKLKNLHINKRRFLRKSLETFKFINYHLFFPCVMYLSFSLFNAKPYIKDVYNKYARLEITCDSEDNYDINKQYSSFSEYNRNIVYKTPWEETEEINDIPQTLYKREVYQGEYKSKLQDKIIELFKSGQVDEEILSEILYLTKTTEYSNHLEEPIERKPYTKITYYIDDKEDTITIIETDADGATNNIVYLCLSTVAIVLANIIQASKSSRINYHIFAKLLDEFDNVDDNIKIEDTKRLEKKIEYAKDNYERLTRGN